MENHFLKNVLFNFTFAGIIITLFAVLTKTSNNNLAFVAGACAGVALLTGLTIINQEIKTFFNWLRYRHADKDRS